MLVKIYTDGAARGNPDDANVGSWKPQQRS